MNQDVSNRVSLNNSNKLYDYWQNATEQIRAYVISTVGLLGASACLAGLISAKTPQIDALLAAGGLSSSAMGLIASKTVRERQLISQDVQDISDAARTSYLAHEMSPRLISASIRENPEVPEIVPFDWSKLSRERDKYPHLLLLGKTGGGKSTLAERLADLLGGRVIAVAPHYQRGDYGTAELIIGAARAYGASALPFSENPEKGKSQDQEQEIDFRDIMSGRVKPSVCQFIRSLYNEMTRRYELVDPETGRPTSDGVYRFVYEGSEILNIILDEFNAYAKFPGISELFKALIREARKVGLRLIVLAQGSEVQALGIEGEGSLRESLTYIWLFPFVLEEAKRLANASKDDSEKDKWQYIIALLKNEKYPILVEDTFAYSPVDEQFLNRSSNTPKTNSSNYPELVLETPLDRPNETPRVSNPLGSVSQSVSQQNLVNINTVDVVREMSLDVKKGLWAAARFNANDPNRPLKKSEIIKKVWGYKADRYSKIGLPLWDELEAVLGSIFDTSEDSSNDLE